MPQIMYVVEDVSMTATGSNVRLYDDEINAYRAALKSSLYYLMCEGADKADHQDNSHYLKFMINKSLDLYSDALHTYMQTSISKLHPIYCYSRLVLGADGVPSSPELNCARDDGPVDGQTKDVPCKQCRITVSEDDAECYYCQCRDPGKRN